MEARNLRRGANSLSLELKHDKVSLLNVQKLEFRLPLSPDWQLVSAQFELIGAQTLNYLAFSDSSGPVEIRSLALK